MKEDSKQTAILIENEEMMFTDGQEIDSLIPHMNVVNNMDQTDVAKIISDETLVGLYDEVLNDLRKKDEQYSGYLDRIVDMVLNEGDSTSSSKEALTALVKILSDIPDKKAKIADLMTRIKLRERDTMPRWLAAKQNNTINISEGGIKREILKKIELQQKKVKNGS